MSVVVFGSINMDLVVQTERIPVDGQTITGKSFFMNPGGKGANQAVAAARMGAETKIFGRVGDDLFGNKLLDGLRKNNVGVDGVNITAGTNSGVATILLDDDGQNRIIVVPAANNSVESADIKRMEEILDETQVLLLQLEIPLDMVLEAAKVANCKNVKVILDPAPARELSQELYSSIDIITPNQSEAEFLVGFEVSNENDAAKAGYELIKRGVGQVLIKMGSKGVFWTDGRDKLYVPAIKVDVVDTVAAGDAFNGCLAASLAENKSMQEAIQWAVAGAGLSVTKQGAQSSMPSRREVANIID